MPGIKTSVHKIISQKFVSLQKIKTMIKKVLILVFVSLNALVYAQQETRYFGDEEFLNSDSTKTVYDKSPLKKENRLQVKLNTGTMYSSLYGNGMFSSYMAPEVGYKVSKKFTLSAGTMMTYSSVPTFMQWQESNNNLTNNKMVNYYMFAKGEYMVTNNLRVRAAGVFDVSSFNAGSRLSYSSVGVDYKIKDNFCISADFSVRNYSPENPMFHNPVNGFYDNPAIRPLSNSLFSEPFPSW